MGIHCDTKAYGRVSVSLDRPVFERLVAYHNRISDGGPDRVLSRIFSMVARYVAPAALACGGPAHCPPLTSLTPLTRHPRRPFRRHRTHAAIVAPWGPRSAALPARLLRSLKAEFGVQHECFTTPLLSSPHMAEFCSLFPDVDVWFGSLGPFFDFWPLQGSFVVNLPTYDQVSRRSLLPPRPRQLCTTRLLDADPLPTVVACCSSRSWWTSCLLTSWPSSAARLLPARSRLSLRHRGASLWSASTLHSPWQAATAGSATAHALNLRQTESTKARPRTRTFVSLC